MSFNIEGYRKVLQLRGNGSEGLVSQNDLEKLCPHLIKNEIWSLLRAEETVAIPSGWVDKRVHCLKISQTHLGPFARIGACITFDEARERNLSFCEKAVSFSGAYARELIDTTYEKVASVWFGDPVERICKKPFTNYPTPKGYVVFTTTVDMGEVASQDAWNTSIKHIPESATEQREYLTEVARRINHYCFRCGSELTPPMCKSCQAPFVFDGISKKETFSFPLPPRIVKVARERGLLASTTTLQGS